MKQDELLAIIKTEVLNLIARENGGQEAELESWRLRLEEKVTLDAPIAELGWDSLRMTWLLVRLEQRLAVDASTLSLYDLFTMGDLVDQFLLRMPASAAARAA